jgi:hypothetical protein
MSGAVPSCGFPVVDPSGQLTPEWHRFLTKEASPPKASQPKTASGSPMSFTATERGSLLVHGGSISSITLTRGRVTHNTGVTGGFIPLGNGDEVTITYTVAPEVHFLAS